MIIGNVGILTPKGWHDYRQRWYFNPEGGEMIIGIITNQTPRDYTFPVNWD